MNVKPKSPAAMADAYGKLLAEKAELAKREKALKEALHGVAKRDADGLLFVNGTQFRVVLVENAPSEIFDSAQAKELLPEALRKMCMKWKAGYISYRCHARVAKAA